MKSRRIRGGALVIALGLGAGSLGACSNGGPERLTTSPVPAQRAVSQDSFVASPDAETSRPRFLFSFDPTPSSEASVAVDDAARAHLIRLAPTYGVSERVVHKLERDPVHDLGHGAIVVAFRQRLSGVEVLGGELRVLLRRDHSLVAVSGTLLPEGEGAVVPFTFALTPRQAVSSALAHSLGSRAAPDPNSLVDDGPEGLDYERVTSGRSNAHFEAPARAKRVLVREGGSLVPAYEVETFLLGGAAHRSVVSASDGVVLSHTSLVADAFAYTVWVETQGDKRPLDGPQANYTPHPRGVPDGSDPGFIQPSVVSMDGFNKNRAGTFDPWLPVGATETLGNNVDAYTDVNAPNGFSAGDLRAQTTSPGAFARVYDVNQGPLASPSQQMAAVTQLFYVTNWLHDYFYDSGFDEAAGNAQVDNYGRGGLGADPLLAEAQDGYPDNRNNANMSTPADGRSPRMQMYVYDGPLVRQSLTVSGLPAALVTKNAPYTEPSFDVTSQVVLADDGEGNPADACSPIQNDVTGKIVLLELGGGCTSATKASRVQDAGGVGTIVVDSVVAAEPPTLGTTSGFPGPYAPTLSIRQPDGAAIRAQLALGPVTARLERVVAPERDGALDNTVVAHEWGHYLHHRLAKCTTHQCKAMSEGFGDFNSLELLVREGDDLSGTFGRGIYSGRARRDSGYFGSRRYPYSIDLTKNPLTFRNIMDSVTLPAGPPNASTGNPSSEVHNAGEVWATAMFEVYVALLKRPGRPFAVAQRRMADTVVAGLKLTPPEATYTEQRDALLAALMAADPEDAALAGEAFAKRGLGACAASPAGPDSVDFAGVVESSAVADLAIVGATLDDKVASCDSDGVLDAGETGRLTVTVVNKGSSPSPIELRVSSPSAGVSFPAGTTSRIAAVPGFGRSTATLPVKLARESQGIVPIRLDLAAPGAPTCAATVARQIEVRTNTDTRKRASIVDDVEADEPTWTRTGTNATLVWERRASSALEHHWHAEDLTSSSDAQLVSAPLVVSKNVPFVLTFMHRHDFDSAGPEAGPVTDGAVVEISDDAGLTWRDVAALGLDPYSGTIAATSGTALAGRRAFVGKNGAYPAREKAEIPLGSALAGKTVRVRFRIVTDGARGASGWDIDDIRASGLDGTPFSVVVPNDTPSCTGAPTADAGPDQRAKAGELVTLDAGASSDPNGDSLAFVWVQLSGPKVELSSLHSARTTFRAPLVPSEVPFTFAVEVSDGLSLVRDSVDVVVYPAEAPQGPRADTKAPTDGCSCGMQPSEGPTGSAVFLAVACLAMLQRRRLGTRSLNSPTERVSG